MDRTHALLSEEYVAALATLLDATRPRADDAVLIVDPDEFDHPPDGEACRRTWRHHVESFARAPAADEGGRTAWRCPPADDEAWRAFRDVVALAEGAIGSHFVYRVQLRRAGTVVVDAIPHHSQVGVNAKALGDRWQAEAEAALADLSACLVPEEPRIEWTAADRRWRIAGGSICKETIDGDRSACYGLTGLRRVRVTDDESVLALHWERGDFPDDVVGRALSWITDKVSNPPERVPCGTAERAGAVRDVLAETLEAFDGREV